MPRVHNYEAQHDQSEYPYEWAHTEADVSVHVEKDTKYCVYVVQDNQQRQILPLRSRKSEARKVAVTWMGCNPEP